MGPVPHWGSWSKGDVPASRETLSLMEKLVGTEGKHIRLSEEGETANLWQTGQCENYTDSLCHNTVCPRLGCVYTSVHGGWELESGDWRANPWGGLLLAVRRGLEGMGERKLQLGMPVEETRAAMEARHHY